MTKHSVAASANIVLVGLTPTQIVAVMNAVTTALDRHVMRTEKLTEHEALALHNVRTKLLGIHLAQAREAGS